MCLLHKINKNHLDVSNNNPAKFRTKTRSTPDRHWIESGDFSA